MTNPLVIIFEIFKDYWFLELKLPAMAAQESKKDRWARPG